MIKSLWVVGILLSSAPAFAASFDCDKASHPEEKAICSDPVLSQLDSSIAWTYIYLQVDCPALTTNRNIRKSQKDWLTETRSGFESKSIDSAQLQRTLEQRSRFLNSVLAECGKELGRTLSTSIPSSAIDMRSGRLVDLEDLLTDSGADQLDAFLRKSRREAAEPMIEKEAPADLQEVFLNCLDNELDSPYQHIERWQMSVLQNGDLSFQDAGCKGSLPKWGDDLNFPPIVVSKTQLKPYLNAYGKSLLLGEGEVLAPIATVGQCAAANPIKPSSKSIQISAGHDHSLLLNVDGKLWAWGRNSSGQLGSGPEYGPLDKMVFVGEGFIKASAGGNANAAIRADGSLWGWGGVYMGKLDDVDEESQQSLMKIGKNFVSVELDYPAAIGLQRDGSLWSWYESQGGPNASGRLPPKKLATDIREAKFGPSGEIIALRKDGSLVTARGFGPSGMNSDTFRTLGTGFSHLGVENNEDLAFRSDGSVWAWGNLSATYDSSYQRLLSRVGDEFAKVSSLGPTIFFAALKKDGSLWGTRNRPRQGSQFERQGCDFVDVAVVGSVMGGNTNDVAVVGVRANGELLMWGNWNRDERWTPDRRMFSNAPRVLGSSFVKIYRNGPRWGDSKTGILALKSDGSVWQLVNAASNADEEYQPLMKKILSN